MPEAEKQTETTTETPKTEAPKTAPTKAEATAIPQEVIDQITANAAAAAHKASSASAEKSVIARVVASLTGADPKEEQNRKALQAFVDNPVEVLTAIAANTQKITEE